MPPLLPAVRLVAPLVVSLVALTGCAGSTRIVAARTDAEAIGRAEDALRGREAVVYLARPGDPGRGRIEFVRTDSTGWTDAEAFWVVPTAGVYGISAGDRGQAARRGALVGAGVGAGVVFLSVAAARDDSLGEALALLSAIVFVPSGAFYGAVGGAVIGNEVEVVFTDGLAAPPGPDEPGPGE